jgi:hypothetical protein
MRRVVLSFVSLLVLGVSADRSVVYRACDTISNSTATLFKAQSGVVHASYMLCDRNDQLSFSPSHFTSITVGSIMTMYIGTNANPTPVIVQYWPMCLKGEAVERIFFRDFKLPQQIVFLTSGGAVVDELCRQ